MDHRNFIPLVLCLIFAGCSAPLVYSNVDLQVRDHMRRASALEESGEYHQAAKEYAVLAEHYPSASCYRTAIWKAAYLNIHPSNSKADTNAALHWMKIYITLPLSREEKESAKLHITMLEHINRLETEISQQSDDNTRLYDMTQKQSKKLAASTQQVEELETELLHLRAQLEEMKEVDLRMHTRRVNGGGSKATILANKDQELRPEAYTLDSSNAAHFKSGKIENLSTQKEVIFHINEDASSPHLAQLEPDPKNQGQYPYTIQVSSFPKMEYAFRTASRSRNRGDLGFTSCAHIPGKGDWYRVFIGFFRSLDEAQKAALELKNREYPSAFAVKMPFAIEIEVTNSDEKLKKMEAALRSEGFLAYKAPNSRSNGKISLLVGAFKTKEETLKYSKTLQMAGFNSSVVKR